MQGWEKEGLCLALCFSSWPSGRLLVGFRIIESSFLLLFFLISILPLVRWSLTYVPLWSIFSVLSYPAQKEVVLVSLVRNLSKSWIGNWRVLPSSASKWTLPSSVATIFCLCLYGALTAVCEIRSDLWSPCHALKKHDPPRLRTCEAFISITTLLVFISMTVVWGSEDGGR